MYRFILVIRLLATMEALAISALMIPQSVPVHSATLALLVTPHCPLASISLALIMELVWKQKTATNAYVYLVSLDRIVV